MVTATDEKTNWIWQTEKLFQQLSEWYELKVSLDPANNGNISLPLELGKPLLIFFLMILGLLSIYLGSRLRKPSSLFWSRRLARQTLKVSPHPLTLSAGQWLKRSQDFASQGNYSEACRSLYMATLQQLHERQLIPHQLSRTDRDYITLTSQLPQAEAYRTIFTIHEQLCFAGHSIEAKTFQHCQQAYQHIEPQSP